MTRDTLTETKIKLLKPKTKPYKVSDGTVGGLHVAVSTAGGKVFCLAYQFDGKWKLLRLGAWPTFTLDEVRDLARNAKRQIATGNARIVPETLRKLIIEGLGYPVGELTTHGLRGMFSTTGNELGYNFEAVEKQLSHTIGNEVSQAYNHASYLRMRRQVVQNYADWLHVQANKVRKKKMQTASEHDSPEQVDCMAV